MDKMDKGMKSMTVTGCIVEKDGHDMLNSAMMAGDSKTMTYDLTGGDLMEQVGHKVEVMGSTDGTMMDKDKMRISDMHGTTQVKSVKMISETCS
jgi:hypothetical protein